MININFLTIITKSLDIRLSDGIPLNYPKQITNTSVKQENMKNKIVTLLLTTSVVTSLASAITPASAADIKSRNDAPTEFQNILPELKTFVGGETRYLSDETIKKHDVNPNELTLLNDHNVKVFFIGETAGGYRNRLDYKATYGTEVKTGKIFGDTSCNIGDSGFTDFSSFCLNPNEPKEGKVAPDMPLNVGDWVDLGVFKAGTKFDFLLYSNDINGGIDGNINQGVFGLDKANNPDGLQHAMSYFYKDYLVIGFEDLWGGGDKDYNDTVFAIDFGQQNVGVSVPEPSATGSLFGIVALGLLKTRRRNYTR